MACHSEWLQFSLLKKCEPAGRRRDGDIDVAAKDRVHRLTAATERDVDCIETGNLFEHISSSQMFGCTGPGRRIGELGIAAHPHKLSKIFRRGRSLHGE